MEDSNRSAAHVTKTKEVILRTLAFSTRKMSQSQAELRAEYEAYARKLMIDSRSIIPKHIRRYNRNYVVRTLGPAPDFDIMAEFAHLQGSEELIRSVQSDYSKDRPTSMVSRCATLEFVEKLVAGTAPCDQPGPTWKRGVFLRREEAAATETVATELSGYCDDLARQLAASADHVLLYITSSVRRNLPTFYYPAETELDRFNDALIMLWPKDNVVLPPMLQVPSMFRVLTVLDFESFGSQIDDSDDAF